MKVLDKIGAYILFMGRIFTKPEKKKVYLKELTNELEKLGLNSVMLVMNYFFLYWGGVDAANGLQYVESPATSLSDWLFDPGDVIAGVLVNDRELDSCREDR